MVRLGVLGCGVVAQMDYLPGVKRKEFENLASVTAVCDSFEARARDVAKRFQVPNSYTSLNAMLENADIEAVLILTPIPLHFENVLRCLEAGKHVYIQKTMCVTRQQADEIVAQVGKSGLKACAAPGQMLLEPFRQAKLWVDSGQIGKACFARAHGSHPGHERDENYGVNPAWYYQVGGGPLAPDFAP